MYECEEEAYEREAVTEWIRSMRQAYIEESFLVVCARTAAGSECNDVTFASTCYHGIPHIHRHMEYGEKFCHEVAGLCHIGDALVEVICKEKG